LGNGTVVEKFDIEKDCAWCGRRLNKDYRYSEGREFDGTIEELVKNYKINDYDIVTIGGRKIIGIMQNYHGRCANVMRGKIVAPIDDY
jgi:hypothetical protein